ncbi:MAG: zinc ABC transporter substrate-binding protein [Parabacteroides sp.]|nr:zinc ABC transporter substrate-binding protein [Parabacteroides sp.]
MKEFKVLISVLFLLILMACGDKRTDEKIVSVTIEPQRYFAEKIAGDKFTVNCVVPAGQSPETYDPMPQQMVRVGKSQGYLRIGSIGFEQAWMDNIRDNNPGLKVFNLSEGIDLLKSPEEEEGHHHEGEEHHHESGHNHHHHSGGVDPHTWSSISGAKIIAKNTLDAFVALDPENKEYYQANYEQLTKEMGETEKIVSALLGSLENKTFIIYHPALTYLANEYGLTQLCIEMDGKEPSPAQLKELVDIAWEYGTKVVFIQQEFDQKNAELIAKETGCRLIPINPLDYDWSKEMIHIAKSLADGQAD